MVKGSERIMSFSTSGISYLQHLRWMVISSILKTIESPLKCFFCGTIMIFHMCLLWMPQVPFLGGAIRKCIRYTASRNVSRIITLLITHSLLSACLVCFIFPSPSDGSFIPLYSWIILGPHHSETTVPNQ